MIKKDSMTTVRQKRVVEHGEGTATKKGRETQVEYPEIPAELQALVDGYNSMVEQAYALLDGTILKSVMPVAKVKLIHISEVQANDYNPNSVAGQEMKLLHTSISSDGYTQPVVAIWDTNCDMVLPCRHFSSLPGPTALLLKDLLSVTQPDFSMGKGASLLLECSLIVDHDGESRSVSQQAMTVQTSATGSETSGESAKSTAPSIRSETQPSSTSTPGTSLESVTSSTSLTYACRTCESSDLEQSKSWSIFELRIPGSTEELGLKVSCLSSEISTSGEQLISLPYSDVRSTPFVRSDGSSVSLLPNTAIVLGRSVAVIVDGFHRYTTMRRYQDIVDSTSGYLPVVVLEKSIADRIASTVRHNRARGKHSIAGMGNLVFQMLEAGEDDVTICNKLGLEAEELARLKHVTGFSKLFHDTEYSTVVSTKSQVQARADWKRDHPDEVQPEGV